MTSEVYGHAIDSGVYLGGVDSSHVGHRLPVDPSTIIDPAVLLIIGQSNGGNYGPTRYAAHGPVFNFNPFDGLCYKASDPLLGATGDGGSPWCLVTDGLIADGFAPSILLLSLCVGGATVAEWAPGGQYHHRMTYALGRLREVGFWPTHVLWHQGEADALHGTSAPDYTSAFASLLRSLRDLCITGPVYVAIASFFAIPAGYGAQQAVIREAQRSLHDPQSGVFPGPDTDVIADRYDGCHLGNEGQKQHAAAWRAVLGQARGATFPAPVRTGRIDGGAPPHATQSKVSRPGA
jgi:hypothetical protein